MGADALLENNERENNEGEWRRSHNGDGRHAKMRNFAPRLASNYDEI